MRKADYASLASIVAQHLRVLNNGIGHNDAQREYAICILRSVAKNFAQHASVDKIAFLKACGID